MNDDFQTRYTMIGLRQLVWVALDRYFETVRRMVRDDRNRFMRRLQEVAELQTLLGEWSE